ncbi:hypothetical protein [Pseudoxanthomonas sp. UTMC 1351]
MMIPYLLACLVSAFHLCRDLEGQCVVLDMHGHGSLPSKAIK